MSGLILYPRPRWLREKHDEDFLYEWANPHPERDIHAVQPKLAPGEGEIMLFALTGVCRTDGPKER